MNVFELRERLISDYSSYIRSFIRIRDERVDALVTSCLDQGRLWPDPLIQLNPSFQYAGTVDDFVAEGLLHSECRRVFRAGKDRGEGKALRLYQHQADAIRRARARRNYVLTTGTGSGKSLAYIIPIVDHVLRNGSGRGIQAIVVYPMNALANSQAGELQKFLQLGYLDGKGPVTFARYTGQERDEERNAIVAKPPDVLLTNYVMLELILTRVYEKQLVRAAQGLRFLVLDELHTYRGRQGADVALLVRRSREFFGAKHLQVVGTSATVHLVNLISEGIQLLSLKVSNNVTPRLRTLREAKWITFEFRKGLRRPGEGDGNQASALGATRTVAACLRRASDRHDSARVPGSHDRIQRALFMPAPQKLRGLLPSQPHPFGAGQRQPGAPTGPGARRWTHHRRSAGGWAASSLRAARCLNTPTQPPFGSPARCALTSTSVVCSVSEPTPSRCFGGPR
jgi:hypothetical protein